MSIEFNKEDLELIEELINSKNESLYRLAVVIEEFRGWPLLDLDDGEFQRAYTAIVNTLLNLPLQPFLIIIAHDQIEVSWGVPFDTNLISKDDFILMVDKFMFMFNNTEFTAVFHPGVLSDNMNKLSEDDIAFREYFGIQAVIHPTSIAPSHILYTSKSANIILV